MGLFDDLVIDRRAQCPYCGSCNIDKRAYVPQPDGKTRQLVFCNNCGKSWRIVWTADLARVIDVEHIKENEGPYHSI